MSGPSQRETRSAASHTGRCARILSLSLSLRTSSREFSHTAREFSSPLPPESLIELILYYYAITLCAVCVCVRRHMYGFHTGLLRAEAPRDPAEEDDPVRRKALL